MRGISAIIVIVLLAVIVISLVTLMYPLFTRLFTTTTGAAQTMANQTVTGLMSGMRVELMHINDVTVRNIGLTNLSGFTLLINGEQSDFTADPLVIEPDKLGTIKILDFLKEDDEITILSSDGATITKKAPDPCDEAVLCLSFDEGSGDTVEDTSGHTGNNGIFYGGSFIDGEIKDSNITNEDGDTPPQRVDGKYGKALEFDGLDDHVFVSHDDSLSPDEITIEAWINLKSPGAIVRKGPASLSGAYSLMMSTYTRCWLGNGSDHIHPTVMEAYLNDWYHLACTFNGTHGKLYVNGVLKATANFDAPTTLFDSTADLCIGSYDDKHSFANGTIDEVRIYGRALTQEEIQADMQSSVPITTPIASWSFEESGTFANNTRYWIKGKYGSALSFDGVDDYVLVSRDDSLSPDEITIEAWINLKSPGAIVRKGPASLSGAYSLDMSSTSTLCWLLNGSDYIRPTVSETYLNDWYHLACTFNGTHGKLYANGVLKATANFDAPTTLFDSTFDLSIGSYYDIHSFANGTIDEVRIYNKAIY